MVCKVSSDLRETQNFAIVNTMPVVSKTVTAKSDTPIPTNKPFISKGCLIACGGCFVFTLILLVTALFIGWKILSEQLTSLQLPANPTIEVVAGEVQKRTGITWVPVISGETVTDGDIIKTGVSAEAIITYPNGSQLRLDEKTEITVQDASGGTSMYQQTGKTWSRVGKLLSSREAYELETPTLVATVRGTAFSTTVTSQDSTLETSEGSVEVAAVDRIRGGRNVVGRILVTAGNFVKVAKADIEAIGSGKKELQLQKISDNIKNGNWFKKNLDRDEHIVESLSGKTISPLDILNVAKSIPPEDLSKLQNFVEKLESGDIQPTDAQERELTAIGQRLTTATVLDETLAADAARALAIMDPENFSDTKHWTEVLTKVLPYFKVFQNVTEQ